MTSRRIASIMAAFAIVMGLIGLYLHQLAVVQNDVWTERSYMNRWAFRDVPTRRGRIVDARGTELAWDVPGFDLELRYWSFRRSHLLGAALHGANLVTAARSGVERFSYQRPGEIREAVRLLLALPLRWLDGTVGPWGRLDSVLGYRDAPQDLARDVRFYVSSVVAALTGDRRSDVAIQLWKAARPEASGDVRSLFAERFAAIDPDRVFGERLGALVELDRRLRIGGQIRGHGDLWELLDAWRGDWRDWALLSRQPEAEAAALLDQRFWNFLSVRGFEWRTWRDWLEFDPEERLEWLEEFGSHLRHQQLRLQWSQLFGRSQARRALRAPVEVPLFRDEARPRQVRPQLDYEFASWFGLIQENHPGFMLRPSVLRDHGRLPGREDLSSLGLWLGRVTRFWADDGGEALASQIARATENDAARAFLTSPGEALPGELEESLRRDALSTLSNHIRLFGRVGRSGVEAACDQRLSGTPGLRWIEHGRRTREQQMFESLDVTRGVDVELTIDANIQRIAEDAVRHLDGAVERALVAIDPKSGDILAMAGRRAPQQGEVDSSWSFGPTFPIGTPYVGSVVKPFVVLEYLAQRRANPDFPSSSTYALCDRVYELRHRTLTCSHSHGAASRDPVEALAQSCNFFFYEAARHGGLDLVERALRRVGWVPGADAYQGGIPGVARTMRPRLRPRGIELGTLAIGYGVNSAALDVARGYAALATGRVPSLGLVRGPRRPAVPLGVPREDLDTVRQGLRGCVTYGTAKTTGLRRFDLYGKTGTARVSNGATKQQNAWFACFLGQDEEASLVVVAVAYRVVGGSGGADAAPMVRRFLEDLEVAGYQHRLPRSG